MSEESVTPAWADEVLATVRRTEEKVNLLERRVAIQNGRIGKLEEADGSIAKISNHSLEEAAALGLRLAAETTARELLAKDVTALRAETSEQTRLLTTLAGDASAAAQKVFGNPIVRSLMTAAMAAAAMWLANYGHPPVVVAQPAPPAQIGHP